VTTTLTGMDVANRGAVAQRTETLFREAGALREGHFELKSGRHADRYLEKFQVLQYPAAVSELCAYIAARAVAGGAVIDVVAGPTTGGVILAFEVARQLRAQGEEVPFLGLGHAINPVAFLRISPLRMKLSKARYHAAMWMRLPGPQRLAYARARARGVLEETGLADAELPETRYRKLRGALEQAAYGYRPQPYDGDVTLFQPIDRLDVLDTTPGWAEVVTGRLSAFEISGEHGTMFDRPFIEEFAGRLREATLHAQAGAFAEDGRLCEAAE